MNDPEPFDLGPRRAWVPDIAALAGDLLSDVAGDDAAGDLDAVGTFAAWQATAEAHGEELQRDDYQSLAIYLAKMILGQVARPEASLPPEAGIMVGAEGQQAVVLMPYPDSSDEQIILAADVALALADDLRSIATEILSESN